MAESRTVSVGEGLWHGERALFSSVIGSELNGTTSGSITSKTICSIDGEVIIRGHSEVGSLSGSVGDVHANGNIWLRGVTTVCGEAAATGAVFTRGKAKAGSIEESVPPIDDPEIAISKYSREADEGIYWNGTCEIDGPCCLGPMYVAGDLVVTNGAVVDLCGTIYVEGKIRLNAGCRIEGSGVLVAEEDITICGEVTLNGECDRLVVSVYKDIKVTGNGCVAATLCAPNGGVFLAGNCVVHGAVVGLSVTCTGNACVDVFPT